MKRQESIHIGCQGWNYDDWVTKPASGAPVFYPEGTRPKDMLELYARVFETVEVDSTFYAVPSAQTVEGWARRTPPHFTFSLKLPRQITHERALRGGESARLLDEFCASARLLGDKLGVVLIQLPPQFEATVENVRALREFLPRLPRDVRFSVEFRASEWFVESVGEMLARHNVALALIEGPWVARERVLEAAEGSLLADFAYVRWMGERNITRFDVVARPQDENLRQWSEAVARLSERVGDVYAYFSNFYEGHAPASANKLKRLFDQLIIEAIDIEDQPSLF